MRDPARFASPLGPPGAIGHALFVPRDLRGIFDSRQAAVGQRLHFSK